MKRPAESDSDALKPELLDQLQWTLTLVERIVRDIQARINADCAASRMIDPEDGYLLNAHLAVVGQLKGIVSGRIGSSGDSDKDKATKITDKVMTEIRLAYCLSQRIVRDLQAELNANIASGQAIDVKKLNLHIQAKKALESILDIVVQ